ncbi:unnamed protein product [Phytomonas sp. EM1]|nr:unnamed protein product [Phytomonas sp. EM1]|eukprot:CCW60507.1 unnamed protein product [Phytomonas sp. isolate EM1]
MGCCHSRKHSANEEDPSVAPKNKHLASGKHSAVRRTPSDSDLKSNSLTPNVQPQGSTAEDEEHERRIAQRDRLEEQRRQNELERLKERGGFISYQQSHPGAGASPEEMEKPILELKVLPHGVENSKHKINTPPTELVQTKPRSPPMKEDSITFSEAEGEVTTGVKGTVLPVSEPPSASTTPLKGSSTRQPLNSATPLPADAGVFSHLEKENSEGRTNGDIKNINQSEDSGENNSRVVPESKHQDRIKETQSLSPNGREGSLNNLDQTPNEAVRVWSTATIEDVQSPCDKQRRHSLSMEDFPDTNSDCETQYFNSSKIIMKKLPPPPTPDHGEESAQQTMQVRNDETEKTQEAGSGVTPIKEKSPLYSANQKLDSTRPWEGVELADVAELNSEKDDSLAVGLDQVAVVLPLAREEGDTMSDAEASRSGGRDDPLPFLSFTGEKSARSALSTSENEGKLSITHHVSGTEKYETPTDVPNLGISNQSHKQPHLIQAEDSFLQGTPMNGMASMSANSSGGGKEYEMGFSGHHADANDLNSLFNNHYNHVSPVTTKADLVETILYPTSHSSGSESRSLAENAAWLSLPEAYADMISKRMLNGKGHNELRCSVVSDQSSEVRPFLLQSNAGSLPVIEEGIDRIDTFGARQTPDRKPELSSESSITAIAVTAGAVPPRRWPPLNPPLPSPINSTNIDADGANESSLRKEM